MPIARARRVPLSNGNELVRWRLPVGQARFHRDGTFFMPPTRFPVALCDPDGYVEFSTQEDDELNPKLNTGEPRGKRTKRHFLVA